MQKRSPPRVILSIINPENIMFGKGCIDLIITFISKIMKRRLSNFRISRKEQTKSSNCACPLPFKILASLIIPYLMQQTYRESMSQL